MQESQLEKKAKKGIISRIESAYERIIGRKEFVSRKNYVVRAYFYSMGKGVSRKNHIVNAYIYPELLEEFNQNS